MTTCRLCGRREYFHLFSQKKCTHCGRKGFKNAYLVERLIALAVVYLFLRFI